MDAITDLINQLLGLVNGLLGALGLSGLPL
jgi:hypothetical protein